LRFSNTSLECLEAIASGGRGISVLLVVEVAEFFEASVCLVKTALAKTGDPSFKRIACGVERKAFQPSAYLELVVVSSAELKDLLPDLRQATKELVVERRGGPSLESIRN